MGSRASQLRNRQQVRDSSAAVAESGDNNSMVANSGDIKPQCGLDFSNNNGSAIDVNKLNNNNVNADYNKIKDTLHAIGKQMLQENGSCDSPIQQQKQQLDQAQQQDDEASQATSQTATKVSTLQRQTSHIHSLAQRIRRSSSLRAPKLKGLIPSFLNGRRKVSSTVNNHECGRDLRTLKLLAIYPL